MKSASRDRLSRLAEASALLVTAEECARRAARLLNWQNEGIQPGIIAQLAEWADVAKAKRDEMVRA